MGKQKELRTITNIVKDILEKHPRTRNSDDYLYYKVCERINAIYISLPFWQVIVNRKEYGYPAFESVRRSRQKLQSEYPELAGCDEVAGQRKQNEAVYRDYARGNM